MTPRRCYRLCANTTTVDSIMAERGISIRPAKINDAELIARVVAFAIGDAETLQSYCGENYLRVLTEVAAQEGIKKSMPSAGDHASTVPESNIL